MEEGADGDVNCIYGLNGNRNRDGDVDVTVNGSRQAKPIHEKARMIPLEFEGVLSLSVEDRKYVLDGLHPYATDQVRPIVRNGKNGTKTDSSNYVKKLFTEDDFVQKDNRGDCHQWIISPLTGLRVCLKTQE